MLELHVHGSARGCACVASTAACVCVRESVRESVFSLLCASFVAVHHYVCRMKITVCLDFTAPQQCTVVVQTSTQLPRPTRACML